jgi:hypothetical protein
MNGRPFVMTNSRCPSPSQAGPSWYNDINCGMFRLFGNAYANGCLWFTTSYAVEVIRMMIKPRDN